MGKEVTYFKEQEEVAWGMLRGEKGTFYLEGLPATCHRAYFVHVYFGPQYVSLLSFCLLSPRMETPRVETCVVAITRFSETREQGSVTALIGLSIKVRGWTLQNTNERVRALDWTVEAQNRN